MVWKNGLLKQHAYLIAHRKQFSEYIIYNSIIQVILETISGLE